jgi:signal transduction histidine kinase/CheY-like chemotaxis protein
MFSVRFKILMIAVACVLACLATITVATIEAARARLEESEASMLGRMYRSHNETLWILQQGCESVLSAVAARPDVRQAMVEGDRDRVLALLQPTFESLQQSFSIVQFYVHHRDGTVMLRVHNPADRGDSYVSHRPLVLDAVRQGKALSGIELDTQRLGMRTVTPVVEDGELAGLLEIGRDYGQDYLEALRARRDVDYRIWLTFDAAGLAGLWPTGTEPAAPTSSVFYYASTFGSARQADRALYEQVINTRQPAVCSILQDGARYSTIIAPLLGYQGRPLGLIEISRSRQEAVATFHKQLVTMLALAIAVAASGIILLAVFLDIAVLRPLRVLTVAARRQYDGDIMARVDHPTTDEFGQLATTFNSLSNRLTDTLVKQRQTIDELAHARHAAEEASGAKDQFLATLSHELRTPLTPALLTAEALEQHPEMPAALRDDIHAIRRNVQLEARLIDDLLDLTRIARGKLELQLRQSDVHSLLAAAIAVCNADIAAKRLKLKTHFAAERQFVMADPSRLQQVFWNLIKNAVKFTSTEGEVSISTSTRVTANQCTEIVIEVCDSGIGMTPETLARIFNVFEQGDRTITRAFGGLGLGLAISKAIVELHAGHISASSPGRGSGACFRVELPATDADAPVGAPDAPAALCGSDAPRQLRILFVEDHIPTSRVVHRLLENMGHYPQVAGTLADARRLAQEQQFDLIISDLGLPDGSGIQLVQELLQRGPTRAIAMSGFGMHEDVERSLAAGFLRHLTKPVTLEQLRIAIASAMASAPRMVDGAPAPSPAPPPAPATGPAPEPGPGEPA